jgi:hypothetical protein
MLSSIFVEAYDFYSLFLFSPFSLLFYCCNFLRNKDEYNHWSVIYIDISKIRLGIFVQKFEGIINYTHFGFDRSRG